MRISVKKEDLGYRPDAFSVRVKLDGEEIKDCFTADEELGEAHCVARNDKGELYVGKSGNELAKVVKRGKVKIIPPEKGWVK